MWVSDVTTILKNERKNVANQDVTAHTEKKKSTFNAKMNVISTSLFQDTFSSNGIVMEQFNTTFYSELAVKVTQNLCSIY